METQIYTADKDDFKNVYPLFEQLWPHKILNKAELQKVFFPGN